MERYWLIGGGVVLAVLLVASVALALAGGETRFDPSSPEHAVQQYVKALAGEDFDAAEAMWSPDLRESCSIALFAVDARRSLDNLSEARITLDDATDCRRIDCRIAEGNPHNWRRCLRPIRV